MGRLRFAVGVLGEMLVTAGVIVLLFIVWEVGYTGVVEGRAQAALAQDVASAFASGADLPGTTTPAGSTGPAIDTVFALVRIPRLGGPTHVLPVYEGTGLPTLAKGLGHYPSTALPGQVGNVGIAGHRLTHGNPFLDIDTIQTGDVVIVETRDAYFVYRAVRHVIVLPWQTEVVAPVPQQPNATPTEAWLTLTSCNPKYSGRERYVVFAKLEQTIPRADGLPPALLADPR